MLFYLFDNWFLALLLAVGVLILFGFVGREFVCWYWKTNHTSDIQFLLQDKYNTLIKKIDAVRNDLEELKVTQEKQMSFENFSVKGEDFENESEVQKDSSPAKKALSEKDIQFLVDAEQWLHIGRYASFTGQSVGDVESMIDAGKLVGVKIEGHWYVPSN